MQDAVTIGWFFHSILRTLAHVQARWCCRSAPVTLGAALDALESRFPVLTGRCAITSRKNGARSCGFSRAKGISRMSRRIRRVPPLSWRGEASFGDRAIAGG